MTRSSMTWEGDGILGFLGCLLLNPLTEDLIPSTTMMEKAKKEAKKMIRIAALFSMVLFVIR